MIEEKTPIPIARQASRPAPRTHAGLAAAAVIAVTRRAWLSRERALPITPPASRGGEYPDRAGAKRSCF